MTDVPRIPCPRCAKHDMAMMWYGTDHHNERPKYRCVICVADAKLKIDREKERFRRHHLGWVS